MTDGHARWRSIAVHVGPGVAADRRVETAILLAQWFDARLQGISVDTPNVDAAPVSTVRWGRGAMASPVDHAALQARFLSQCASFGLGGSDVFSQPGHVAAALVLASHAADVLVVTQPHSDHPNGALRREDLEVILRLAARPVLILPATWDEALLTRRVLVGWDGSSACARAVVDALPLLRAADNVEVIRLTGPDMPDGEASWWPPLRDWLRRHDVIGEGRAISQVTREACHLRRVAELIEPDLVVMGAYGDETWRAPWIGRTTRDMLETASVPLLVSH